MSFPLTVSLTPSFRYGGDNDWLLRAQLRCLSEQEFKDFDVVLIDPHYQKRKGYMPELAKRYNLNLVHIPYTPNLRVAKRLDCACFNAPYLFSESPKIVRYSCWRFVLPQFTKICVESKTSVDFYFHNVEPVGSARHPETDHNTDIWNLGSDVVHWDKVPKKAGEPGATWGADSDIDKPASLFFRNAYGNYAVSRKEWIAINGVNEGPFSVAHFEDQDFCVRARSAEMQCSRRHAIMWRAHHRYGNQAGRANELPDFGQFKQNCPACEAACNVLEPNRFDLKRRIAAGEVEEFEREKVWICKTCFLCGPVYHVDSGEYLNTIEARKITKSSVFPKYLIGRRLDILTSDMDGKSLSEKVEIFNASYTNERYFSPHD